MINHYLIILMSSRLHPPSPELRGRPDPHRQLRDRRGLLHDLWQGHPQLHHPQEQPAQDLHQGQVDNLTRPWVNDKPKGVKHNDNQHYVRIILYNRVAPKTSELMLHQKKWRT
jgi:hypothetical protein